MQLIPQSWGSAPLREFNPCHSSQDGKFCSEATAPYADARPAARASLGKLRDWLRKSSLFDGPREQWRESASVMDEAGQGGAVVVGGKDSVGIAGLENDLRRFYNRGGTDAAMFHTHPSSSAFSFSDLAGLVSLNDFTHPPALVMPRSVVLGQDGSTYELRLKRRLTQQDVTRLEYAYQDIRDALVPPFQRGVEGWAQKLPGSPFEWQPSPFPGGAPRLIDRASGYPANQALVTKFAESVDVAGFERTKRREWKRASVAIWRQLQREFPQDFEFRYRLEDM